METQVILRSELTPLLRRYRCPRGIFRAERGSRGFVLSLQGNRNDGKPVFVWEWPAALQKAVHAAFDEDPGLKAFRLTIDLNADTADYRPENAEAYAARQEAERKELEQQHRHDLAEKKRHLAAQTEPYGETLALRVLAALQTGAELGYTHRDYCGTGLWTAEGRIIYGEWYDGGCDRLLQEFASGEAFVQWLAAQSDASLARLEEDDAFYRGNQTLTRSRLEAFCGRDLPPFSKK